jgi:hypothetical protein
MHGPVPVDADGANQDEASDSRRHGRARQALGGFDIVTVEPRDLVGGIYLEHVRAPCKMHDRIMSFEQLLESQALGQVAGRDAPLGRRPPIQYTHGARYREPASFEVRAQVAPDESVGTRHQQIVWRSCIQFESLDPRAGYYKARAGRTFEPLR